MAARLVVVRCGVDGEDGADANLPAAAHERTAPAAPDLSILAAQADDRAAEPRVVRRCDNIPVRRGFLYLVAIMDCATRKVLVWRLSNTMDASFCVAALEEALARYGRPEIFNTDRGSQFTSLAFTSVLHEAEVRISMDGPGAGMDNVFIERPWRSLEYACVCLHAFEMKAGLGRWVTYYNTQRPHSGLAGRTPVEAYRRIGRSDHGGMHPMI